MLNKIMLFLSFAVLLFSVGCKNVESKKDVITLSNNNVQSKDNQQFQTSNIRKIIKETIDNIEYTAIVTAELECCIQHIDLQKTSIKECKKLVLPERVNGYKVVELSGRVEGEEKTTHNIFGDVMESNVANTWICKEKNIQSEKVIKEIIIPNNVKVLKKHCFSGMESLEKISLPKGLEEIKGNIFYSDKKLTTITIPSATTKGVEYLSGKAWKRFKINSNNPKYKIKNGVLLSKDGRVIYGICTSKSAVRIGKNVTKISSGGLTTNKKCNISVDKRNKVFAKSGQCIYKRKNGELVCISASDGKVTLSEKVKMLNNAVMVAGKKVKYIKYATRKRKNFSLKIKLDAWNHAKWNNGYSISNFCTWDLRGRNVPKNYLPENLCMRKIIVLEKDKKAYKKWLKENHVDKVLDILIRK